MYGVFIAFYFDKNQLLLQTSVNYVKYVLENPKILSFISYEMHCCIEEPTILVDIKGPTQKQVNCKTAKKTKTKRTKSVSS